MLFDTAIKELNESGASLSTPESFVEYLSRTNQKKTSSTPAAISVQSISDLRPELREAKAMIFRLGCPKGKKTTEFGLARVVNGWSDFFLIDDDIFAESEVRAFVPSVSYRDLYAFSLFPNFTETTLVNLALASGLMKEAFGLEETPSIPVTGRSNYSFDFYPRTQRDPSWTHHNGQVEIDGVFTGRREGRDRLFIVEAKNGTHDSLAKTKLLYPYLSLRPHIPSNMPISLIYLRANASDRLLTFDLAECHPLSDTTPSLIDLKISFARRFSITRPGK